MLGSVQVLTRLIYCFPPSRHQVIARALGGSCVRNELGWEIGVYDVELTEVGKEWIGRTGAQAVGASGKDEKRVVMAEDVTGREKVDKEGKKVMVSAERRVEGFGIVD